MFPETENDCVCCMPTPNEATQNTRWFDRLSFINFINQLPMPEAISSINARSYWVEITYNQRMLWANIQD